MISRLSNIMLIKAVTQKFILVTFIFKQIMLKKEFIKMKKLELKNQISRTISKILK